MLLPLSFTSFQQPSFCPHCSAGGTPKPSPMTSYLARPMSISQSSHYTSPLDCIFRFFFVKLYSHVPVIPHCPALPFTHHSLLLTYRYLFGVLLYSRDICEHACPRPIGSYLLREVERNIAPVNKHTNKAISSYAF